MKIAEVANILDSVPPKKYGGTEYVISAVTEGLVHRGHDVTLYATGDSQTSAKLSATLDQSLASPANPVAAEIIRWRHLDSIAHNSARHNLIHNHILETAAILPQVTIPVITTLHTDLSYPNEQAVLPAFTAPNHFFVSISNSQRKALPDLPYVRTIYHGLNAGEFPFNENPDDYLFFLGRITPEKGPHIAIEIARQTGKRLIIAAKIDQPISTYARKFLQLVDQNQNVEFIGEVGEEKKKWLSGANAFLMPIQWEEPFGLVVIEALACGTPVIAFNRGSMPEIIEDGKTGFIVNDTKEMIAAIDNIPRINRHNCRNSIEKRFTIERMLDEYEQLFKETV